MKTTMPTSPPPHDDPAHQQRLLAARTAHWERTRRMTFVLMALWLATGFGTVYFARELAHFTVFGWPLSFYMAAQGASLVSLALIALYAWRMRVLDQRLLAALKAPR
jgi:putative solute:sodium symporter small subunit